ncbi:antibiotic biosynthesis monooxygenase [Aureimonas fodinaquatilis]|uniref:Antibiotic biosynthesis monooxygenase n=1 Tax=Aureimonas fodinaquatilis TaxID=2565783 RepID=A0A5B0DT79_9HYPH|nr:putative quinol monooxygenase [Aureimonas fodinaquatilis]KAA0969618.1 antibiotic biosynthesis monooxygenase [Aureimonas fodinaquatilis]
MSLYTILVEFDIKPGHEHEFAQLVTENAQKSVEVEPGCHQFDVWTCSQNPQTFVLYEIYENEAAFRDHMSVEHFKLFDAAIGDMVADKRVRRLLPTADAAA